MTANGDGSSMPFDRPTRQMDLASRVKVQWTVVERSTVTRRPGEAENFHAHPHPSLISHPVFISYARTTSRSQAEVLHRELGADHPHMLTSMGNLAATLADQGDDAGAEALFHQVLERHQRLLGTAHPDTLTVMHNLATTLAGQGDDAGAEALHRQVLEGQQRVLGRAFPHKPFSMAISKCSFRGRRWQNSPGGVESVPHVALRT